MPIVTAGGLHLYYQEDGVPEGPALVLLHGFSGTGDMWAAQREAFGARYRLVIPDLRGHGRTDNPDGLAAMNHRQFSRDITGLCQALEIEQAIFCGLSTGAMLLLTLGL